MIRTICLKATFVTAVFSLFASAAALAGNFKTGDTVHVKPMSIWFEESEQLGAWQAMKQKGDAKALEVYEKNVLSEREAWQFGGDLVVSVLAHKPQRREVKVKLLTEGRLKDSIWFVDESTIVP